MVNVLKNMLLAFLVLEIICFILVVKWLGLGGALLLFFITSMAGLVLLRKASKSRAALVQQLQFGVLQGLINTRYALAGFLLLFPGFLTDILGVCCLVPLIHHKVHTWFQQKRSYSANDHYYDSQPSSQSSARIIEGECWQEEDHSQRQ